MMICQDKPDVETICTDLGLFEPIAPMGRATLSPPITDNKAG